MAAAAADARAQRGDAQARRAVAVGAGKAGQRIAGRLRIDDHGVGHLQRVGQPLVVAARSAGAGVFRIVAGNRIVEEHHQPPAAPAPLLEPREAMPVLV